MDFVTIEHRKGCEWMEVRANENVSIPSNNALLMEYIWSSGYSPTAIALKIQKTEPNPVLEAHAPQN